jgi:hypothetical protein
MAEPLSMRAIGIQPVYEMRRDSRAAMQSLSRTMKPVLSNMFSSVTPGASANAARSALSRAS